MDENLSTIVIEKLEKDNFQSWKFKMTNFLMGKGVWPFINGNEQEPVLGATSTDAQLKTFNGWHEKDKKVIYWFFYKGFRLHDCAYIGCKDAKGDMGYIGEAV